MPHNNNTASTHSSLSEGLAYLNLKKFDKALLMFDEAIESDPTTIVPFIEKEKCLRGLGRALEADELHEIIDNFTFITVTVSNFPRHDPYSYLFNVLVPGYSQNPDLLNQYLELKKGAFKYLIDTYSGGNLNITGHYNDEDFQAAYILYYYPYYIETIFRELEELDTTSILDRTSENVGVCFYGCGAAPEYLGALKFISSHLKNCKKLSAYFFEKNSWDQMRENCIKTLSNQYCDNPDLMVKRRTNHIDLLAFAEKGHLVDYPEIQSSDVHIFQNCLRDLLKNGENSEKVTLVIENLFAALKPGSILIFTEMYYPNVMNKLKKITSHISKNDYCRIVKPVSEKITYSPKFEKPPALGQYFRSTTGKNRLKTHYFSFIAMKT